MKPLIVALDVESEKEALTLVRETKAFVDVYKIGPGLVLRYGPDIFKKIKKFGKKIFLDLKFHDIPSTMVRCVKEAGVAGVFSSTVHLSAGEKAMKEIVGVRSRPQLWGVTVLTSLSEQELGSMGIHTTPLEQVLKLGTLAKRVGLNGVVASVGETVHLRQLLGKHIQIITPGIRLPEDSAGDQVRTATPQHARLSGADFIVVGRSIIESKDPMEAAEAVVRDWNRAKKKS